MERETDEAGAVNGHGLNGSQVRAASASNEQFTCSAASQRTRHASRPDAASLRALKNVGRDLSFDLNRDAVHPAGENAFCVKQAWI